MLLCEFVVDVGYCVEYDLLLVVCGVCGVE